MDPAVDKQPSFQQISYGIKKKKLLQLSAFFQVDPADDDESCKYRMVLNNIQQLSAIFQVDPADDEQSSIQKISYGIKH